MSDLLDLMQEAYAKPDPNPFAFKAGQVVRVLKGRSNDGQTPACWDGALGTVVSMYCTGLYKDHWYKLQHNTLNATCEFKEDELDARYKIARNNRPKV